MIELYIAIICFSKHNQIYSVANNIIKEVYLY